MNFLQLCQRLRSEAGMTGSGPTTTVGQTGDSLRIVEWIQSAYEDILNYSPYWRFMLAPFSFQTVADQQSYTPAQAGVTDLLKWKIVNAVDARVYLNVEDEQYLDFQFWDVFKANYLISTSRSTKGKPDTITINPDNSLWFYQIPNDIYTVNGEYYKQPAALVGDEDVPVFPQQFHMAIVWRALMLYGAFDAADERYSHGQNEYRKILQRLRIDQLPRMTWGPPLV